jgi:tetratricopeptide (TPR) repeat protein
VAAAAVLLLSVVSSVGMLLLAREQGRTREALDEAKANFERAEQNFHDARDVVDQFGVRMADRLTDMPGMEPVRRQLLANTLRYYRAFVEQAGDDPSLQHELALAHFKSGVIAAKLGDSSAATGEYDEARQLLGTLAASKPHDAEITSQLALVDNNLAIITADRDVEGARKLYEQAIAMQRRLVAEYPNESAFASQLAESVANLGMLDDGQGRQQDAERRLSESVSIMRSIADGETKGARQLRNLAIALNNLSFAVAKRDALAAERPAREAIEILERISQSGADGQQYQDDLALAYNNLAALESRANELPEAIESYRKAVALEEQLVRKAPGVVRSRSDLAVSLNNLGVALCRVDKVDESQEPFDRSRELMATLASDYPEELTYQSSLAALLNNEALALASTGRHEQALSIYPVAIAAQRNSWERAPNSGLMQELLSKMYYNECQSLVALGKWNEAAEAALARREVWRTNGERLFGVAVELAAIDQAIRKAEASGDAGTVRNHGLTEKLDGEVIGTLQQAAKQGFAHTADLAGDERFAYLQGNKGFQELVEAPMGQSATADVKTSGSAAPD